MTAAATYLVIETRDPFAACSPGTVDPVIEGLAGSAATTVVLAQNGVLGARRGSAAEVALARLAASARVVADDFALRERGVRPDELVAGVGVTTMDEVVGLMLADGCRVLWH
jgi:hypothetical protein